jgi:hypothetical protein
LRLICPHGKRSAKSFSEDENEDDYFGPKDACSFFACKTHVEGRRLSARFGRGARDPPAMQKKTGLFCRKKAQKAQEISATRFCAFSRLRVFA